MPPICLAQIISMGGNKMIFVASHMFGSNYKYGRQQNDILLPPICLAQIISMGGNKMIFCCLLLANYKYLIGRATKVWRQQNIILLPPICLALACDRLLSYSASDWSSHERESLPVIGY